MTDVFFFQFSSVPSGKCRDSTSKSFSVHHSSIIYHSTIYSQHRRREMTYKIIFRNIRNEEYILMLGYKHKKHIKPVIHDDACSNCSKTSTFIYQSTRCHNQKNRIWILTTCKPQISYLQQWILLNSFMAIQCDHSMYVTSHVLFMPKHSRQSSRFWLSYSLWNWYCYVYLHSIEMLEPSLFLKGRQFIKYLSDY
jgi:hypothetical protein